MANYVETEVTGNAYRRCRSILVTNNLGGSPRIEFIEQDVVILPDGESMSREAGSVSETFTAENAATEFFIVDSATLEPTAQTATYWQVFGLLQSAYAHLAKARDAANVPPVT
jgi:hypothetical protein